MNVKGYKVSHHATRRYVSRVEGLNFSEVHMTNYTRDNHERVNSEILDMLSKSTLLFRKPFVSEENAEPCDRYYYSYEDIILITQNEPIEVVVTILRVKINVPEKFSSSVAKAAMEDARNKMSDLHNRIEESVGDLGKEIDEIRKKLKAMEVERDKKAKVFEKEYASLTRDVIRLINLEE